MSLTPGNEDDVFDIMSESGQIRLIKSLDYEYKQLYTLTVRASNRPPESLSSTTRVCIYVEDVNDNAPRFESEVIIRRILENERVNSVVSPVIRATDADEGENAVVSCASVPTMIMSVWFYPDLKDTSEISDKCNK